MGKTKYIDAKEFWNRLISVSENDWVGFDTIDEVLSEIPSEQRWIPITERLPEVGSEVLVCYDFNGIRSVYISNFYGDGEFHGLDDEYLTNEGRRYRKAVAWMPLPEPYKGGAEE